MFSALVSVENHYSVKVQIYLGAVGNCIKICALNDNADVMAVNVYTIVNCIAQVEAVSYLTFHLTAAEGHGNILRTYGNCCFAANLSGIREGNAASLNEYSVTLNLAINKVNQTDESATILLAGLV